MDQMEYVEVVVDHDLEGVTPEMIDWWWYNLDPERYKLWHPKDHKSFRWEAHPRFGHEQAIHVAEEDIGEATMTLRIRWEDPKKVPIPITMPHAIAASIIGEDGEPMAWLVHQYERTPKGTRMRSTFRLPPIVPEEFAKNLYKHCREEMGNLPRFLPELYRKETEKT
ncbi:MAG: phloretin hydrolase [Hadesarchaea archaeon]|nr:MAG: phloretin hydrolase [Hadesarchaea archaeon]